MRGNDQTESKNLFGIRFQKLWPRKLMYNPMLGGKKPSLTFILFVCISIILWPTFGQSFFYYAEKQKQPVT